MHLYSNELVMDENVLINYLNLDTIISVNIFTKIGLSMFLVTNFIGKTFEKYLENFITHCYGDLPHDVTAWILPNTINSD